MKVREIMTTNVECIAPETDLVDVAQMMKTLDVGFLGVCHGDRLIGTVTDRDVVIRGIAGGRNPETCTAQEVMTPDVFWCFEDDDIEDVAEKMRAKEVRRILILNQAKRLVGVVSIGDIAKVEEKESGRTLKDITEAA
jgi:CBS domain-containing protein